METVANDTLMTSLDNVLKQPVGADKHEPVVSARRDELELDGVEIAKVDVDEIDGVGVVFASAEVDEDDSDDGTVIPSVTPVDEASTARTVAVVSPAARLSMVLFPDAVTFEIMCGYLEGIDAAAGTATRRKDNTERDAIAGRRKSVL
ncbi:hypothetical protein NKR23_g9010 [Pleurostoma richardsiae]|uniref:Uncharacterized protein n=1 Tax=Pleurostoma richardsiae TaxID=41990 RepID=A0AA38RRS8_9PEZI|nr:hypothetical protein NKR23_g9010 [Pleurostoma richardsiae]